MDNLNEQQLTKRERRLLKREQKREIHLQAIHRKKRKKTLFILLPIILIVSGIVFALAGGFSSNAKGSKPRIELSPEEYDAGTISMADGKVKYTYEIQNMGEADLDISRIWTSCMCTTARLRVGGKESEEFGMHSTGGLWSQKIAQGEVGYLEVVFDPAFHGPQRTGEAIRVVYLSTNDPNNKQSQVKLMANVIK